MPRMYEIELQFTPCDDDPDDAGFEEFLDSVTDELAKVGIDADYTSSAADLRASWTIEVPDATEDSLIDALNALRAALAAAGRAGSDLHEVLGARSLVTA